jgi:cytochrome c oxidase subunit 3
MREQTAPDASALQPQFIDADQQREAASLGIWVFLATEVLFFGGLVASYTIMRLRFSEAFAAASRETSFFWGTFETAVLLTSSLTMAFAVRAAKLGRSGQVASWLGITILLGLAFFGIHIYEYVQDYVEGHVPGFGFEFDPARLEAQASLFFFIYYSATLLHLLHLTLGVALLATIGWMAVRDRFSAEYHTPVEISGLYWHFVDIVWIFLYPMFYLIARN